MDSDYIIYGFFSRLSQCREQGTVASFSIDRNSHMWWEAHHSQSTEWGYVLRSGTDIISLPGSIKSFEENWTEREVFKIYFCSFQYYNAIVGNNVRNVLQSMYSAGFKHLNILIVLIYSFLLQKDEIECDNFITVIEKVTDTFVVCGTNVGTPKCWLMVRD